jgi:hypothetical protein
MTLQHAVVAPSGGQVAQQTSAQPAANFVRNAKPNHQENRAVTAVLLGSGPNWNFASIPATTLPSALRIQSKLRIGASDDPLEREADKAADRVDAPGLDAVAGQISSNVSGGVQRKCDCDGSCPKCQEEESAFKMLQKKSTVVGTDTGTPAPPSVDRVLRSAGRPLDPSTQTFMEQRFSHDFSQVRVHAGEQAGQSAKEIDAQAYTVGANIVFAHGQYAPSQPSGRRLIAHELTHVVQQTAGTVPPSLVQRKSVKVAGCGLLNLAGSLTGIGSAAHIQIQEYLAGRGITPEFPIPRATKLQLGWGCRKLGTEWGYADLARRAGPGFELAEIKPVTMAGRARAKLEVGHYRRRATQSMQRLYKLGGACARRPAGPDDVAFATDNVLTPLSGFSLLSGVLMGDETIGPFSGDPSLMLKAKETSAGAVCYWCTKDQSQQQTKPPKPPGPNVGIGVSIGGSAGGAYNAGVGISVQSDSTAYGTAGAGISYKSDTKAAGAAGAGASIESDSAAAGAAGAGATKDTQSVGAGVAGAGKSTDSVSAGAGAAGAGSQEESATAGAGVAGKGTVKESAVAGAGASASGKVEGVQGAGTGSPGKPVDVKDTEGGGKSTAPQPAGAEGKPGEQSQGEPGKAAGQGAAGQAGQAGTGTSAKPGVEGAGSKEGGPEGTSTEAAGKGTGSGKGPSKGGSEGATAKGAQGAKDAGPDPGTGTETGGQEAQVAPGTGGTTAAGQGKGTGTGGETSKVGGGLGVGPVLGPNATEADRQKAAQEAAKAAVLLAKSSPAQIALFRYLSQTSPDGRFVVPTSQWVDTMMKATEGLSEDDIQYLRSLNWKPAKITPEELRKKILEVLKDKKPPAPSDTAKGEAGDKGKGKAAKGSKAGDADNGKKGKGPKLSGFVQPRKYTGEVTVRDIPDLQIQPTKQITLKTRKGAKATLEVRWLEGGVVRRANVQYEIIGDPVLVTEPSTKKQMWRFDMKSANTDALVLSPEGTTPPTVLPPGSPASYYMFKK